MAEVQSDDIMSCSNCLEKEGYIFNPLSLPCGHPCCEPCISGQPPGGKVKCAVCKVKHTCLMDNLQSAIEGAETFCDPCKTKGEPKKTANVFCTKCERKYCAKHAEVHDEVNDNHTMLGIRAYQRSSFAETLRHCDKHTSEPITIGCKSCWTVLCPLCLSSKRKCTNGASHDFMALIEIATELTQYLEPTKQRAEERIDKLSGIIKETTVKLNQWDSETEGSVEGLNQTRDEQVRAIIAKYADLEKDYRSSRDEGKQKLTDYREEADIKLTKLHDKLQSLRSEISNLHVVDLIQKREDLEEGFSAVMTEDFPGVTIDNQKILSNTGKEIRDTKVKIERADDIIIKSPDQLAIQLSNKPQPTSIELIKEVTLGQSPTSVCQYKGFTYVGCNNGAVDRIDEGGNVTPSFMKLANNVTGVIAHDDRLYTLVRGQPYTVYVHDLTGQQLHTWSHADRGNCSARALAVINNEIIIADRTNKTFTIYTLKGKKVRDVKCDLIFNDFLSICHESDDSIIVANYDAKPDLYKVNLTTGTVEWRSDKVTQPFGISIHSRDFALVTHHNNSNHIKLSVLSKETGEIVREITDPNTRPKSSYIFDMCLDGDTLIIPMSQEKVILFYKLKYDN